MRRMKRLSLWALSMGVVVVWCAGCGSPGASFPNIDPQADQVLRSMSETLGRAEALKELAEGEGKLRGAGIMLWLAGLNPKPLHTIRRLRLGATLGQERMFLDIGQAVEAYRQSFGQGASNA